MVGDTGVKHRGVKFRQMVLFILTNASFLLYLFRINGDSNFSRFSINPLK